MNAEQHEWYWKGYNDAKKQEPKHEWIGLEPTDWPLPQFEYSADFQVGAQWAADKLKEKNT